MQNCKKQSTKPSRKELSTINAKLSEGEKKFLIKTEMLISAILHINMKFDINL